LPRALKLPSPHFTGVDSTPGAFEPAKAVLKPRRRALPLMVQCSFAPENRPALSRVILQCGARAGCVTYKTSPPRRRAEYSMDEEKHAGGQLKVAVPVRVRGVSNQNRFFDEETETDRIGPQLVVTHLPHLLELETEVHVTSLKTTIGGIYRVLWVNARPRDGRHYLGLELLDPEGDLWGLKFPSPSPESPPLPEVRLECQRCHGILQIAVPEADEEFLSEGFLIAHHCDGCKGTTPWGIPAAPKPEAMEPETRQEKTRPEQRFKGRAPLKIRINAIRQKWGVKNEDICTTENVSRTGVLFLTQKNYEVGEAVEILMPYKEGEITAIPVPARVVRVSPPDINYFRAVAIHLVSEGYERTPRPEQKSAESSRKKPSS